MNLPRYVLGLIKALCVILIAVGIWLFFRYIFKWVLPFLIAILLARVIEPMVKYLVKKTRLSRRIVSGFCTLLCYGAIFAVGGLIVWRATIEISVLLKKLPTLIATLPDTASGIETQIYAMITAAPVEIQTFLRSSIDKILSEGITIPQNLYTWLGNAITGIVAFIPLGIFFVVTCMLATYFMSCDYSRVTAFMIRQFPQDWQAKVLKTKKHFFKTLGMWFKAQFILMLITFAQLALGFIVMRVEYALLLALLISLVDALPIIGAGFALVPWAAVSLLTGDFFRGIGLLILFCTISLIRSFAEPKMISDNIGLSPVPTLVAMYVGMMIWGVWGLIFLPIFAMTLKQIHEWGYVKLWK